MYGFTEFVAGDVDRSNNWSEEPDYLPDGYVWLKRPAPQFEYVWYCVPTGAASSFRRYVGNLEREDAKRCMGVVRTKDNLFAAFYFDGSDVYALSNSVVGALALLRMTHGANR